MNNSVPNLEIIFDNYNCKQAFLGLDDSEILLLKMKAISDAFDGKDDKPTVLSGITEMNIKGEIVYGPWAGDIVTYYYDKRNRFFATINIADQELDRFHRMTDQDKGNTAFWPRLNAHIYPVKFKKGEPHNIKIQAFVIEYDEKKNPFKFDDIDDDPVEEEPKQEDTTTLMNVQLFGYGTKGNCTVWPKELVEKAFKDAFDSGRTICTIAKDSDLFVQPDMSSAFGTVENYEVFDDRIMGEIRFNKGDLGRCFRDLIDDNTLCLSPRFVGNIDASGAIENLKILSFNPISAAQFKNQFRKEEDTNE